MLQVRWLQQAEAGTLALEEEDSDAKEFATFDVGPPGDQLLGIQDDISWGYCEALQRLLFPDYCLSRLHVLVM